MERTKYAAFLSIWARENVYVTSKPPLSNLLQHAHSVVAHNVVKLN